MYRPKVQTLIRVHDRDIICLSLNSEVTILEDVWMILLRACYLMHCTSMSASLIYELLCADLLLRTHSLFSEINQGLALRNI